MKDGNTKDQSASPMQQQNSMRYQQENSVPSNTAAMQQSYGIDVTNLYNKALSEFIDTFKKQRLWRLIAKENFVATGRSQNLSSIHRLIDVLNVAVKTAQANDAVKTIQANDGVRGLLDARTGLRYPPADSLAAFLKSHPFVFLQEDKKTLALLHAKTGCLWYAEASDYTFYEPNEGKAKAADLWSAELQGWRLPTKDELKAFATAPDNPYREGQDYRLFGEPDWLTIEGRCDVDKGFWNTNSSPGHFIACHDHWVGASPETILVELVSKGRHLAINNDSFRQDTLGTLWQGFDAERLMHALTDAGLALQDLDGKLIIDPDIDPLASLYNLDYIPCRLPLLELAQIQDPHKGLWELWGNDETLLKRFDLVARDPKLDTCTHNVAIDFGTSSTVVALSDEHGGRRLLRIGVRDFYQTPRSADFENPTVLEFIDYARFHAAWISQTYRPALDWNWVHAAHEAQASFRDNPGDTAILASILPRLKQWALRSDKQTQRIRDRQGMEIELSALTERNPVRGQPMNLETDAPFDPIEIYAWFLGMTINWRGRGLYYKYHLTFPVKYEREVKDKILASFRRGLQRSLPATLVMQPAALQPFSVTEIASEPAAYAAAALPHLDLNPGDGGLFYAVFDFGGGTTDFDFGLWRLANDQEADEGYDQVFDHLRSAGDNYLGGENLLERLVYHCFRHNLEICRTQKIHFTRPLGEAGFTGDEAFVHPTQAAQTNTVLLASKLRPFMESNESQIDAQLKIELLDKDGNKKTCELSLDKDALDQLLFRRMEGGVKAFLSELASLREEVPTGQPVHILLAGNGSRSRHITALFDAEGEHWPRLLQECFGDAPPEMVIHPPLPVNENNHHAPTAKTGVALGVLRLCPGENVKLIDQVRSTSHDEAPFRYFVGKLRRDEFIHVLSPHTTYEQWHLLGPLHQGVFKLGYSTSARARSGMYQGDVELRIQRFDFPAAAPQDKLFVRAVAPTKIELTYAPDEAVLSEHADQSRIETVDLEIG